MRKSERIRILELEVLALHFQVSSLSETLKSLIELNKTNYPSLDADKWYFDKFTKND